MQTGILPNKALSLFLVLIPLFLAFELYGPSLRAPFFFDDRNLPFAIPCLTQEPVWTWISGNRLLLIVSYWLNASTGNTGPFHVVNILVHVANSLLAFAVLRHFLHQSRLALFLAAIFLVHPLQTESVVYIAGPSESLSAFFLLSAYAVFLKRAPGPTSWGRSLFTAPLF